MLQSSLSIKAVSLIDGTVIVLSLLVEVTSSLLFLVMLPV